MLRSLQFLLRSLPSLLRPLQFLLRSLQAARAPQELAGNHQAGGIHASRERSAHHVQHVPAAHAEHCLEMPAQLGDHRVNLLVRERFDGREALHKGLEDLARIGTG